MLAPNPFCLFLPLFALHVVGCFPPDLLYPPNVYLIGTLLLNFRPSTNNSSVTSPLCLNEHCVISSMSKIGNLVLIKLSQPLVGC